MMNVKWVLWLVAALGLSTSDVVGEERVLFGSGRAGSMGGWQTVNDGVMGGRSVGQFGFNAANNLEFFGTLSLENNGGFASVRARSARLPLRNEDFIVLRVRGDGREYSLNLYTQSNLGGYSYRQSFRTRNNEWTEVTLPVGRFFATWRGRTYPNERLDPSRVSGLGIFLGDKRPGPFKLEIESIRAVSPRDKVSFSNVSCQGTYPRHLQGIAVDDEAIYWSFTTTLVKTDLKGSVIKQVRVADHHGDLCVQGNQIHVAVNLGEFNDPDGRADSWVYVYDTDSLQEVSRHSTPEVIHGAGGIGIRNGHFFVVGGLPEGVQENSVYEYDGSYRFVARHVIKSGHTHLGIQTATFARGRWWFGCYGDLKITLVTDPNFQMKGKHGLDSSLGIVGLTDGRLLVAGGSCDDGSGCVGQARIAIPDDHVGFRLTE
ncbi:MAG: CIA30 family protein [Planctomycetota bacterium]